MEREREGPGADRRLMGRLAARHWTTAESAQARPDRQTRPCASHPIRVLCSRRERLWAQVARRSCGGSVAGLQSAFLPGRAALERGLARDRVVDRGEARVGGWWRRRHASRHKLRARSTPKGGACRAAPGDACQRRRNAIGVRAHLQRSAMPTGLLSAYPSQCSFLRLLRIDSRIAASRGGSYRMN